MCMCMPRGTKNSKFYSCSPPPHPCAFMIPPGLETRLEGAQYEVFAVGGDVGTEWLPDCGTKDFTNAFIADEKNKKVCGHCPNETETNWRALLSSHRNLDFIGLQEARIRYWDVRNVSDPIDCSHSDVWPIGGMALEGRSTLGKQTTRPPCESSR